MITFAGIPLLIETPELRARCEDWWFRNRMNLFEHPGYNTANFMGSFPTPQSPDREPPRLGVLRWPSGAARWATFHHFVTGGQLAQIRAICYAAYTGPPTSPGGLNPDSGAPSGFLVMDDGNGGRICPAGFYGFAGPQMCMLPPRPVFQSGADESQWIWLLTLVDDRYFWWQRQGTGQYFPTPWFASTNWGGLFLTPAGSAVSSNYNNPESARWFDQDAIYADRPLPLLLDAQAARIGRRIVFTPGNTNDNTVTLQDAASAVSSDNSQWATYSGSLIAGGRLAASDIIATSIPATAWVIFSQQPDIGDEPIRVDVTLSSLSLSAYGGASGISGAIALLSAGMDPRYDLDPTDQEAAQLAYATQLASDWYSWQLSLTDATFKGIVPWQPTGLEDAVEWEHTLGDTPEDKRIYTRVIRRKFGDENLYGTNTQIPLARIAGGQIPFSSLAILYFDNNGDAIWSYLPAPTSPNPGTQTYQLLCVVVDGVPSVSWT